MVLVIKLKDLDVSTLSERDNNFYKDGQKIFLNTGYVDAPYGCNEDTILLLPKSKDKPIFEFFIQVLNELNVRYKNDDCAVFDPTGQKNQALMDNLCQPFIACFLLEPVRYNGRVDFWVKQIRVKTIKDLPEGFEIIKHRRP